MLPNCFPSARAHQPEHQAGEIAPQTARGADSGPVAGWGRSMTPGRTRSSAGGRVTKGLFDTHQGTMVPKSGCEISKLGAAAST